MKYPLKRALALLIALLLALPTFAFADETANENVEIEIADEDWLIMSDEIEPPVEELGEILLGGEEPDDATDPQKPSPSVEGVGADALTDEVVSTDATAPQEPSPSVEGVSADALTDEVASADATAPQEPSPSVEGVSADALTDEVVPALLAADGDGDTELQQPPAGNYVPQFYIASACTAHGDVSASPTIPISEKPGGATTTVGLSSGPIQLFATPHQGYVLKGWEIVSVGSDGEPEYGYYLPVTKMVGHYEFTPYKSTVPYFRITALFEQEAQPITVQVDNFDKNGTFNTGSGFTASETTVYAGETVTLTLNMAEGAQFAEPENGPAYPQITYTSVNENTVGDHDFTIIPAQDGNTWTFTVPDDIDPQYPSIRVLSSFTDVIYGVTKTGEYDAAYGTIESVDKETAAKGETVTVKVHVTKSASFDTETGLTVSYTDGDETKTVPVTLKETSGGGEGTSFTDYTYTFVMPAHAVTVSAEITPKGYTITLPTISDSKYHQTLTVDGVLMTDHIALRAEEGAAIEFEAGYDWTVGGTQGDDTTTQGVKRLYYTVEGDETEHDITITEPTATLGGKGSFIMPAGNVTLGVVYETAYKVGVTQPDAGGTIGVSQRYAFEGDTVTVTAEPETGDATNTWFECTVSNGDGEIEAAHADTLTVTFTMPNTAVLVSGTITPAPYQVTVLEADQARLSVDRPIADEGDKVTVTVLDDDTAANMVSVYYMENGSTKHVKFTAGTNKTGTFTMPATDVTVRVNPPVTYWQNGSQTYNGNYTVVTSDTTTWTTGWYVVNENVVFNQRIEVSGNAKLVIMGTSENNYCSLDANTGIHVPSGSSLVIYGETNQYGVLTACTVNYALPSNCAAIGGNNGQDNGPITIHSGTVTALSKGKAAAIGGGYNGDGSQITINGGTVVATCSDNGAGIGGGECFSGSHGRGHHITINGGNVFASGGEGAGIGGGSHASGYNIRINGGAVSALGSLGAGIGGGDKCLGYDIVINGGSIYATGIGSAGIGCGAELQDLPGHGNNTKMVYLINGGRVEASSDVGHALVCGDAGNNGFILTGAIYLNAKVKGGSSSGSATVISGSYDDIHNSRYILIEPCTHENATYEVISAETHLEQCDECLTEFTEEAHTYNANGVCTVCGYDSHSSYVFFDSAGGSNVEAQRIANGEKATRPDDPAWEGHTFQNWYRVTDAATGAHEAQPFDFENTAITESVTLIAVWSHEHDGITFQSWNSDSSLPSSAGSYFLTKDVTLTSVWSWNGGTLNLCLAGHTVTGNIDNSSDALITVNGGTLNLFDEEDGTVTLVNARAATVAVETGGTFNLHGGTITSETNDSSLQGVDVAGTFHMSGGRITGNPTGVRVKRGGAFTVSGSARVTGNTVNVDLTLGNGKIQIGGALSDDARIGVTAQAGVFTNGLNGGGDTPNGTAANFFSDSDDYLVALNAAGEAMLETAHTVTFEPGDENASGYMPEMRVGSAMTLPACDYSVEGKVFKEWSVKIGSAEPVSKQPEETIEITADTTVTAVWEEATAEGDAVLIGSTASFSGNILLNFYIKFSGTLFNEEGAFVRLTFKGQNHDLPIANADYNATYKAYRFSLSLVAKEIQEDVTVRVYHADGNAATFGSAGNAKYTDEGYHYSLLTYTQNRIDRSTNQKMIALARAAQDYCTAAQIYFKYNATDLSVSGDVGTVTQAQLEAYAPVPEGELPAGVSLKGITAMFESDNSLRLYLQFDGVDASSFEYKVDGKTATLGHSDNGDYLEVANVAAKRLGDKHVFSISNGTNTLTYTASVLTYARNSMLIEDASEARKNLCKALYLYCQAAKAYFNYPG